MLRADDVDRAGVVAAGDGEGLIVLQRQARDLGRRGVERQVCAARDNQRGERADKRQGVSGLGGGKLRGESARNDRERGGAGGGGHRCGEEGREEVPATGCEALAVNHVISPR